MSDCPYPRGVGNWADGSMKTSWLMFPLLDGSSGTLEDLALSILDGSPAGSVPDAIGGFPGSLEEEGPERQNPVRIIPESSGVTSVTEETGSEFPHDAGTGAGTDGNGMVPSPPSQPRNTHFYLSAKLDATRINRDVHRLMEEVVNHLTNMDGSVVNVSLEVDISAPNGFPQDTVRTVSENCQTLRVENFGFDD